MNTFLLAQAASTQWRFVWTVAFLFGAFILPFIVGRLLANALRMREYGWRIGLILSSVVIACVIIGRTWDPQAKRFKIPLGVDLQGGVILIYEVEDISKVIDDTKAPDLNDSQPERKQGQYSMSALIEALGRRINPSGTKEIVVRPYGAGQVEIIIPEVDQRAVEQIKKVISTSGVLQFRIVANTRDHQDTIIEPARTMALDQVRKRSRIVVDDAGDEVGLWARVGREAEEKSDGIRPFRVDVSPYILRDASSGELLSIPPDIFAADRDDDARRARLARYISEQGIQEIDVLMATNDALDVKGDHLASVMKSTDERMSPCIVFDLTVEGAPLFSRLTGDNEPDGNFARQLGIVLDNELLSAPNIQEQINEHGRITGRFTDEEVTFLVNILEAGSLPVVLNKNPISQNTISPLLGRETIEQGKTAMIAATVLVFAFMLIYYRFSGFLACLALIINILLTLAIMVLIKAPLTMPGLAGLVLTIGMSVDANVLIFERMREELTRGAALRMTIRNGFARATATIIDANVTTILTAVILYAIGTDQLRGFAVVLILGILTSMFTAIFCARVAFDIVERTRLMSSLKMFQLIGVPKWDFVGKSAIALSLSGIILAIGLVGVVVRGQDLFDIDFTGGSSVHVKLEKPADSEKVRAIVDSTFANQQIPYTLTGMSVAPGQTESDTFKIDAKVAEVDQLERMIHEAFQKSGGDVKLARYSLAVGSLKKVQAKAEGESPEVRTQDTPANDPTKPALESTKSKKGSASDAKAPVDVKASQDSEPAKKASAQSKDEVEGKPAGEVAPAAEASNVEKASPDASAPSAPAANDAAPATPETPSSPAPAAPEAETPAAPADTAKPDEGALNSLPPASMLAFAFQQEAAQEAPAETERAEPANDSQAAPASNAKSQEEAPASATQPAAAEATSPAPAQPPATATNAEPAQPAAATANSEDSKPAPAASSTSPAATEKPGTASTAKPTVRPSSEMIEVDLTFGHPISEPTLRAEIEETARLVNVPLSFFDLSNPAWQGGSNAFNNWTLRIPASSQETQVLLDRLQERFSSTPVWSSSNKIGPQVAGKMQRTAIAALVASWIGIIIYVWIRFQNIVFGLAAVVALIHDVLITIAALAISRWLAGVFGFLLIEDFKISLTIVAALLTIIGYSINDTIVIFDRLREIRGKSPTLTTEMVNLSLNQTLSRTLLTALTVFIVVIVLYAFGGQGIHGFAFAMVIGVVSGTYSTIYIATPLVLWLGGKSTSARPKSVAA